MPKEQEETTCCLATIIWPFGIQFKLWSDVSN